MSVKLPIKLPVKLPIGNLSRDRQFGGLAGQVRDILKLLIILLIS